MLRKILIASSYLGVAAIVVVATIVLVAYGQGYSYNFRTHTFNLNGLLVLDSTPQGAQISINGKPTRYKTPYRTTMEAGTYTIDITKEGYVPWRKEITIKASEVSYVPQIVFIPTQLKVDTVSAEGPVTNLTASQDQRHFAYMTGGSTPGVWSLSVDRKQSTKLYTPRAAHDDVPAETLTSLAWSNDSSHILVRTQVGAASNYIVVPVGGGTAINLTDLFKFDLAGLTFSPNDWRELYWMSPEGLRRINVEGQTVSAVIAEKVSAFTFADDRLVFIQTTPLGKTLTSSDRSGRDQKRLIESIAESASYEMQYADYRGRNMLAVLPAQTATVTVYSDIFSATPIAKVLSKSAQHIAFNDDGQYLAFYSDKMFGSYEVDKDILHSTDLGDARLTALSWFDSAHVLLTKDGKVTLSEIDYGNATNIGETTYTGPAFSTTDQRRIIWLSGSEAERKISIADIKP